MGSRTARAGLGTCGPACGVVRGRFLVAELPSWRGVVGMRSGPHWLASSLHSSVALTRVYQRADPLGRRQIKWVVYGFYVGLLPSALLFAVLSLGVSPEWIGALFAVPMICRGGDPARHPGRNCFLPVPRHRPAVQCDALVQRTGNPRYHPCARRDADGLARRQRRPRTRTGTRPDPVRARPCGHSGAGAAGRAAADRPAPLPAARRARTRLRAPAYGDHRAARTCRS